MAGIAVRDFRARIPRRSVRLLPTNFAVEAVNVDILSGSLRGFHGLGLRKILTDEAPVLSVYRVPNSPQDAWLTFDTTNVDVARAPIVNDSHERYYWTAEGSVPQYNTKARIVNGDPSWDLGVPRPTSQPVLNIVGGSGPVVDRAYTYAFVTELGEIGPGSDPTLASGFEDAVWNVSGFPSVPPDSTNRSITHINIYRTITSTSNIATYFFVAQVPLGTLTYADADSTALVSLNEQYDGFNWLPPPAGLLGLIELPFGSLAGFTGTDLYFSEPFRPHAWPVEYVVSTDYPIVGLAAWQNGLMVLTTSHPYMAFGNHPAAMALTKSSVIEPCLSKRSIVSCPEGVYYASQSGLVLANASGIHVTTRQVIDHEQWDEDFHADNLIAAKHGTKYLALDGTGSAFLLDPAEEAGSITTIDLLADAVNVVTDVHDGEVLVIVDDIAYEWDAIAEDHVEWSWKSKEFQLPVVTNLGVACVHFSQPHGESGLPDPVLTVWAGGVQVWTGTVQSGQQQRLPSGFKSDVWQFSLSGKVEVHSAVLAQKPADLTQF